MASVFLSVFGDSLSKRPGPILLISQPLLVRLSYQTRDGMAIVSLLEIEFGEIKVI